MIFPDGTFVWFTVWTGRRGASAADVYDTATYDLAVYDGGTNIDWTPYESRVLGMSTRRGKDAFGKRFRTGQLTIDLDNSDGVFTGDAFLPGDYVWVQCQIRFPSGPPDEPIPDQTQWQDVTGRTWTAEGSGMILSSGGGFPTFDTFGIFYGRVDSATDKVKGGVDTTTVRVLDQFADLAIIDKAASASQGAGESTYDRAIRILTNAGSLITWDADGGPAEATMQATTLAGKVLSDLQLVIDSEGGDCWADTVPNPNSGGIIQLKMRDWLTTLPRSTVIQWRLGSDGVGLVDAQQTREAAIIVNDATFASAGGTAQNSTDPESIQRFGDRTHRRLDLICEGDTQPQFLAQRMVGNLAEMRPRIKQVTIPWDTTDAAKTGYEAQFGDLVLARVNSFRGHGTASLGHIIGIEHVMVGDEATTVLSLSDAFADNVDGDFDEDMFDDSFALGGAGG